MEKINFLRQKQVLKALAEKIDEFYLAGGTALSMMYFQHRESYDLDFFTKDFSKDKVVQIIHNLQKKLSVRIEMAAEQLKDSMAKMLVYMIHFDDESICKIDFVEDSVEIINDFKRVDGINILSLEDIYLRKIYAVAGHVKSVDVTGKDIWTGGRQEAKDFYDLFCLSSIHVPLSNYMKKIKDPTLIEGLITWYRTYDRITMKTGLLDLVMNKQADFRAMEDHFKNEIDQLIAMQIGEDF